MNNQAIPMDIGRSRAPNRGGYRNPRGQWCGRANVTSSNPPKNTSNARFQCGEVGHYARECPTRQKRHINLIDFDPAQEDYVDNDFHHHKEPGRVETVRTTLAAMTFDEKQQLAHEMAKEANEDFPTA